MTYEYLEVTTQIGCPVKCWKYCPQEVTVKNYSGKRTLSQNDWKIILSHIPKKIPLVFSGFCEPFANSETIKLIDMAYETGHPLGIYTTLYQASRDDVDRLIKYPFLTFCLHLPDGNAMKIPLSQNYKDNVFTVLHNVKNVSFSIMNDLFKSTNRENIARGRSIKNNPFRFCVKLTRPQFNLLPNGNVILCSHDFNLSHILGNLLTENYSEIRKRFLKNNKKFKLCSLCYNNSFLSALLIFGKEMLMRLDKTGKVLYYLKAN